MDMVSLPRYHDFTPQFSISATTIQEHYLAAHNDEASLSPETIEMALERDNPGHPLPGDQVHTTSEVWPLASSCDHFAALWHRLDLFETYICEMDSRT